MCGNNFCSCGCGSGFFFLLCYCVTNINAIFNKWRTFPLSDSSFDQMFLLRKNSYHHCNVRNNRNILKSIALHGIYKSSTTTKMWKWNAIYVLFINSIFTDFHRYNISLVFIWASQDWSSSAPCAWRMCPWCWYLSSPLESCTKTDLVRKHSLACRVGEGQL